jgi:CRP-like cAMP-binding protein
MFSELPRKDLERLAGQMELETFLPGQNLITQGERGARAFVIVEGTVKILVSGRTRRRATTGALLGELALLTGGERAATVQAETPVEALSLSSLNLLVLLEHHWSITHALLRSLAWRLRQADKTAYD